MAAKEVNERMARPAREMNAIAVDFGADEVVKDMFGCKSGREVSSLFQLRIRGGPLFSCLPSELSSYSQKIHQTSRKWG